MGITDSEAQSTAASADCGCLTGSNSPYLLGAAQQGAGRLVQPAEDGRVLERSRSGCCSKSSLLLSRVQNLASLQRLASDASEYGWAPGCSSAGWSCWLHFSVSQ